MVRAREEWHVTKGSCEVTVTSPKRDCIVRSSRGRTKKEVIGQIQVCDANSWTSKSQETAKSFRLVWDGRRRQDGLVFRQDPQ